MYMENIENNEIQKVQGMIDKSKNRETKKNSIPKIKITRKKKSINNPVYKSPTPSLPLTPSIINPETKLEEVPRKNEIYANVLDRLSILMKKKGDNMRSGVYNRAQDTILSLTEDITNPSQLEGKQYIGNTIINKLNEYDKTGTLVVFEREKENPDIWLTDIHGIGPKKAQELVSKGIQTIDQLRDQKDKLLNDTQRIGLQYYDDIMQRIPRTEIQEYDKLFNSTFKLTSTPDKNMEYEIVGSYRRGAKTSGDIDVIITGNDSIIYEHFINKLKDDGIIIETLSKGNTKSMVITKLPGYDIARRVDFMFTPLHEYPYAILYFTGSKSFNTAMRGYALKLGISLNEHGMYEKIKGNKKGDKISRDVKTEEDIFKLLFLKYKLPEERLDSRSLETTLPIIPDSGEKKGKSCYKSCESVPIGECATGCSPSWENDKLKHSRNWCTCNLKQTDCIAKICPTHGEPNTSINTTPSSVNNTSVKPKKIRKTNKKIKLVNSKPKITISNEDVSDTEIKVDVVPILTTNDTITNKSTEYIDSNINIKAEQYKNPTTDIMASDNTDKLIDNFRKNGIAVIEQITEQELSSMIEAANIAYYNTKKQILSDTEYDIIKEYMERKYPNNSILQEIGAKVIKNKVTLPYKMASMDKIKPDTNALIKWGLKYEGPYVLSCKLDGVSGLYTTEGDTPKLYTRGNGTIGQDVSHLISVLKLPKEKGIVVRGEFIIPRTTFEEKYKDKFANPRNMVSGIVNSKTVDSKANDLHFVTYELIRPIVKPSEQLVKLQELNYEVVLHNNVDTITNESLSALLMDWRTNHEYEIDGVIVTDDHIHARKEGNPEFAFAFKMVISDQIAEAKVVDVIWTPSKSGYLKPRVRIEPIQLGGVTIEYATGFNGKFIEDNKIGIGAMIQIIRSGDVIPYIKSVTIPAENTKMPDVPYHWTDKRVDIVIDNVAEDTTVQEKNITEFFKGIEVDGLGPGNVRKIMKAGYINVPEILKMTKEDFGKVDGFKTTMVNKIYNGIEEKIKKASLLTVMAASNKFGRGIGLRKIKPIIENYPNVLTDTATLESKKQRLLTIDGIGKENANSFVDNIHNFLTFMEDANLMYKINDITQTELSNDITTNTIHSAETTKFDESHPLYNKHIVMTKVRDNDIINYLKSHGGVMDDNISKKTFILIVGSINDVSNKTKKANSENIPIMTPEMFKCAYM